MSIGASEEENNALCAMATSMPYLVKFGWSCPTTNACGWNPTLLQSTMVCTGENVTSINLTSTQISGTIPTQIGQLKDLNTISFIEAQISGTIPTQLSQINNLQQLNLESNQISGTIPTQIGQLKYLTIISIGYVQISGTIPTQLSQITNLQYLFLYSTKISGTIPTQLSQITYLQVLDFSSTQISGTIPTQLSQIINLKYLDLSYTQISGTIPTQLSQTNLQFIELQYTQLQYTQLCGCPHLPNLIYCNLTGIPLSCNCSILSICHVSQCNGTFICLTGVSPLPTPGIQSTPQYSPDIGSTPLSIPSIQPTSQLSPYIGSTPLSIPSIQPTSQLSPNIGCHGNYGTLFTCKDEIWTSITDVVLNGTNLLQSIFNLSTLFVNGNVLISESSINIENNLFIQKQSMLTLQNCSLFISGDLYINAQSTIILNTKNNNFTVYIKHCAFLDGSLVIITHQSQTLKRLPILTSQCMNGTFSSVFVNLTDTPQCNDITTNLEHYQDSLFVYFDLVNYCNSEIQSWIYIVIGIVGLLLLIVIIGSFFAIMRYIEKQKRALHRIKDKIQMGQQE